MHYNTTIIPIIKLNDLITIYLRHRGLFTVEGVNIGRFVSSKRNENNNRDQIA